MLKLGEESGRIAPSLEHLALRYRNDTARLASIFTYAILPLAVAGVGVLVCTLALTFFSFNAMFVEQLVP